MKITKDTGISVGVLITLLPLLWFFGSKADKKDVERVAVKTEVVKEEVDQEENINIQQQGQIDSTLRLIEKLDKKLDKALE